MKGRGKHGQAIAGHYLHDAVPGTEHLTHDSAPHLSSTQRIALAILSSATRQPRPPNPALALRRFSWEEDR